MSSLLLKLYSSVLVTLIIFLSVFLYKKITDQEKGTIIQPIYTQSIPVVPTVEQLADTTLFGATSTSYANATSSHKEDTAVQSHTDPAPLLQHNEVMEIDTVAVSESETTTKSKPCVSPITYRLGTFDSGFDISKKEFLQKLASSALLWSDAIGKELFTYSEQGEITINLIYDKRQEATIDNKLIGAEIQNTKDAADALEVKYEALKVTFNTLKDEYAAALESFNTRQKEYTDTVTMWNGKGGAPQYEYDKLNKTRDDLEIESKVLTEKREVIVTMLKNINDLITKHNDLILFANSNVARSNSQPRKKFTEGQYTPHTKTITIYQFTDDLRLHRVLAHEFGHALGINHNKNPLSIMYYTNTATTTGLTKEDIRDLRAICNN